MTDTAGTFGTPIPPGITPPPGATAFAEQWFDLEGATSPEPVSGGRVEWTFYGAGGELIQSLHGIVD